MLLSPGNIIFFDWEQDGHPDYVGIVEYTDEAYVYTVEGNSGDACVGKTYGPSSVLFLDMAGLPAY